MTDMTLDEPTESLLQRFGYDSETFERLARRSSDPTGNALRGKIDPPGEGDVHTLPEPQSAEHQELSQQGEAAIREGKVGVVVLAGGMATRFGGVVKAAVPAVRNRTFLELKLADVTKLAERLSATIPIFLMTSFATDEEVERLGRKYATARTPVHTFAQFIALRFDASGAPFRDSAGALSPYAPGHGDLTFALRQSGHLRRFLDAGGTTLAMSNVDNLGATLDAAVLGAHLASGKAITAEVVRKDPGDKGGAPARVDGVPQIVESFRFPSGFDQDSIPVFNTNSFVLDAHAIDRDFPLTYFLVKKKVDGREAIQFERLVGEVTAFLPTGFLEVPRGGPNGRFQPVKDPEELASRAPDIEALLTARGVL